MHTKQHSLSVARPVSGATVQISACDCQFATIFNHLFFSPCCMTHSASHAPMDFAIGGGYVQPQRSPREATIRWAFMPPDVSQGRGERRGLPIDAGCGRGREFEESLGQGALRRDG